MGFTIYYATARSVTSQEAEAIITAAEKECERPSWFSCEPLNFFPDLEDGILMGGSRPNFTPHPDDKRSAQRSGLPDDKLNDLLDILARISRAHAVDWQLTHDSGPVGFIQGGVLDPRTLAHIEAISEINFQMQMESRLPNTRSLGKEGRPDSCANLH